jgi:hypothetical protein
MDTLTGSTTNSLARKAAGRQSPYQSPSGGPSWPVQIRSLFEGGHPNVNRHHQDGRTSHHLICPPLVLSTVSTHNETFWFFLVFFLHKKSERLLVYRLKRRNLSRFKQDDRSFILACRLKLKLKLKFQCCYPSSINHSTEYGVHSIYSDNLGDSPYIVHYQCPAMAP